VRRGEKIVIETMKIKRKNKKRDSWMNYMRAAGKCVWDVKN